jgi:hypothetical protein
LPVVNNIYYYWWLKPPSRHDVYGTLTLQDGQEGTKLAAFSQQLTSKIQLHRADLEWIRLDKRYICSWQILPRRGAISGRSGNGKLNKWYLKAENNKRPLDMGLET